MYAWLNEMIDTCLIELICHHSTNLFLIELCGLDHHMISLVFDEPFRLRQEERIKAIAKH